MTEKHPTESPPPYTETSSTEPPDYDTLNEQAGFLNNSSRSNTTSESSSRTRSPLLNNISYDMSRGPIGNILNMAEKLVENATNAANVALGGQSSTSTADFSANVTRSANDLSANVTRSANDLANNVSKTAMDIVEGFMNKKDKKRESRRDCRKSHKARRNNDHMFDEPCSSTQVPSFDNSKSRCGNSDSDSNSHSSGTSNSSTEKNTTSDCDSNTNNNRLEMSQRNAPLVLDQSWSGSSCHLKTTNGPLTVRGSLSANNEIELESSNGTILVEGQLLSSKSIYIKTSNGVFNVQGKSIIANDLNITTSNAPLNINSFIQATHTNIKTKNAVVNLGNVSVGKEFTVKTSNAPIEIHIMDISSKSAKIEIETSNAPVNVFLPISFSGYFSVKSNSAGSAKVSAKSIQQSSLNYHVDEKSKKEGTCNNSKNKSDCEIYIKTSNAAANLYI